MSTRAPGIAAQARAALEQLDAASLRRHRRAVSLPSPAGSGDCASEASVNGRLIVVEGKPRLAFASNDYLGLAADSRIAQALAEGALTEGAGSGASALISGHRAVHAELEARLAGLQAPWIEDCDALYLSSGYAANLALVDALTGLATRDGGSVELFSEALNHASLVDGCRLARAHHGAAVRVFAHRDLASLARLLEQSEASARIILTDSVFSMDGDLAPLTELARLAEATGAWLIVDDAHGLGVLGREGRGVLEHLDLRSPNLVYMGTLGKAIGVAGAFVAATAPVIDWLVNRARTHVFSTSCPPALAHALLCALSIATGPEGIARRNHLKALSGRLRERLRLRRWHWPLEAGPAAIHPVIIGDNEAAQRAARLLFEEGLWVPAIRPPTVPAGTARLRITLSAAHTEADIDRLADALMRAEPA
jgi:8-amino-7-oxononanoate synthase